MIREKNIGWLIRVQVFDKHSKVCSARLNTRQRTGSVRDEECGVGHEVSKLAGASQVDRGKLRGGDTRKGSIMMRLVGITPTDDSAKVVHAGVARRSRRHE
jgi:hypothetical protein